MSKHSVLLEGLKRNGNAIYFGGTKETPGLNILDGTKEAETVFQKSLIALWVLMDMF